MSTRTSRILLAGCCSVAVALCVSGLVQAQDKSVSIPETKQRLQVLVQQFEKEVTDTKKDAKAIVDKDLPKPIAMLRTLRDRIATNADLPHENRNALLQS